MKIQSETDYEKLESDLHELAALGDNWDSYGAPPIDKGCIKRTRKTVLALMSFGCERPSLVPCSKGGIELSWTSGKRWTLEIELAPGDKETGDFVYVTDDEDPEDDS